MCVRVFGDTHAYLGSFFLDPEVVRSPSLGAVWNFIKGTGLPWIGYQCQRHKWSVKIKAYVYCDRKDSNYFIVLAIFLYIHVILIMSHKSVKIAFYLALVSYFPSVKYPTPNCSCLVNSRISSLYTKTVAANSG